MASHDLITVYYDSSEEKKEECKLYVNNDIVIDITDLEGTLFQILTTSSNESESVLIEMCSLNKEHHKPLFQIAFYDNALLTTQYDNRLIRHADPDAIIPPYALFHQTFFNDVSKEITPIVHVFIDADFDKIPSRFCRITSSSIWNYCIGFHSDSKDPYQQWLSSFKDVVKSIYHNKEFGLYDLAISQEYADLYSRLTEQAYISFGYGELRNKQLNCISGVEGGHGDRISPYLFHSEFEMQEKLKKENVEEKYNKLIKNYKWRFLLVDDKIDENDSKGFLTSSNDKERITKRKVLEDRITSILDNNKDKSLKLTCKTIIYKSPNYDISWKKEDYSEDIIIICVENIKDATTLMKECEFDIILLDYLLGKDDKGNQEYGYTLLEELHDLCEDATDKVQVLRDDYEYQIGPQGKFFFMFISAFTTAISERLNVLGLSRNEDIWEIGEGACPTNTPELFKYRLIHLMKHRLIQSGIEDMQNEKLLETIGNIYREDEGAIDRVDRISSVRKKAHNAYHKILGLHYDFTILHKNDKKTSRLVSHFLEDKVHFEAMLEHLLQLIHLTAFGTVRQWPEIWEEYKFFTRTAHFKGDDDKLSKISRDIEKYIIDLKKE